MKNGIKKCFAFFLACAVFPFGNVLAEENTQGFFKPGDEYKTEDKVNEVTYAIQDGVVSYSDMEDLSVVGILGALDIMGPYEENAFRENVYASRGEFADGAMKLIGAVRGVDLGGLSFYDVDESNKYYNAICSGVWMGILKGYDDNTFRPDTVISYKEAIKILKGVLGYTDSAFGNAKYSSISPENDIIKGVSVKNMDALTRGEMAQLLYNTLNSKYIILSKDKGSIAYEKSEKTLLEYYFKIKKATGRVTANINGEITEESKNMTFAIDDIAYDISGSAYNEYLGYKVTYYYDEDNNIVMMCPDKHVSEISIDGADIVKYDSNTHTIHYETDGKKTKTARLSSQFTLIYNGAVPKKNYDETIFLIGDGSIRLVSNDGSGDIDTVLINEYRNFIVTKTSCADDEITFFTEDSGSFKFDAGNNYLEVTDENKNTIPVYKTNEGGKRVVSVSELPSDAVASIYAPYLGYTQVNGDIIPTDDLEYMRIVFSSKTVEGKVRMKDTNEKKITIDDASYSVAKTNFFDDSLDDISFDNSVFYLDFSNQLVDLKNSSSDWKYGYLIRPYYDENDDLSTITELKMLTTKNKIEVIGASANLSINGKKNSAKTKLINMLSQSAALIRDDFKFSQLIKYIDDEDGAISRIQTVTKSIGISDKFGENQLQRVEAPADYVINTDTRSRLCDANNSEMGKYFKPKLVFKVSTVENDSDKKYATTSLETNGKRITLEIYDTEELLPGAVVYYVNDTVEEIFKTSKNKDAVWPVMFDEAYSAIDEDDMTVSRIKVVDGSGMAEYDSEIQGIADGFKRGDLVYLKGIGGKVTEILPIKYGGAVIGANNLPDVSSFVKLNSSIVGYQSETVDIYMLEPYSISGGTYDFVLQGGAINDGSKREVQLTGSIMNDEWFKGGMMVYDEEEDMVLSGSRLNLKLAKDYGNQNASRVLCMMHNGAARAYYVYNLK